jgi:AraC-like DNA-binding protein
MLQLDSGIHRHAHGERIEPTLFKRSVQLQKGIYGDFHHMVLLSGGGAVLHSAAGERLLIGPALASVTARERCLLAVQAGSHGLLIGASPQVIADAIGNRAESHSLRILTGQTALIDGLQPQFLGELTPLMTGFVGELADSGRSSWIVVSAYLRLILIAMLRAGAGEASEQAGSRGEGAVLQRYRQLVESWFLLHRPIRDYARELGATTDRLHAICRRELGRSPIQLLHERIMHEAKLRLERSEGTIKEISDKLGFREPTHFSQFFSKQAGMPPAKYRRLAKTLKQSGRDVWSSSYADWP